MPDVTSIRNICLCGHGSSGKTTIADKLLALTGAVSGTPDVENGTSICDFDPEEKHHKYSIETACTHFDYQGRHFNLLDTPGYPDFIGQTICAMHGVDTALVVVNAHSGIEVNTRRTFDEAGKLGLGRMVVINKMDEENIDFQALVDVIREMWGNQCVLLNVPLGVGSEFRGVASTLKIPEDTSGALVDPASISEPLIESIIEVDEAVMEKYFEGTMPSDEELSRLIVQAVRQGTLIPIVCCSARTGKGLVRIAGRGPHVRIVPGGLAAQRNPGRISGNHRARSARNLWWPASSKRESIRLSRSSVLSAFFPERLKRDAHVAASSARKGVKMGQLLEVQGEATANVDTAGPGDIVAVAKMEDLHTGTVLGDCQLPPIVFPTPMVSLAVTPKSRGDETKLSGALAKIVEEDPTFHLDRDAQTKELVVTGMSELHLAIIQERLKRRDKLEVDTKEPRIAFRETIQTDRRRQLPAQETVGGPRPVRRSPYPDVPVAPGHQH